MRASAQTHQALRQWVLGEEALSLPKAPRVQEAGGAAFPAVPGLAWVASRALDK